MGVQVQAPIAVTSGAFVNITAKAFARRVEIAEDATGGNVPGGLIVLWPNGNTDVYTPSQQPIVLGNPGGGSGPLIGIPAGAVQPAGAGRSATSATLYCQIKSVGATSQVRVSETN